MAKRTTGNGAREKVGGQRGRTSNVTKKLGWRERGPFLCALMTIQLALIAFFLASIWPGLGMPYDDSWIHLTFVRNLAENGVLGFNDGEWSGGTTSLLWDVLLAPVYWLSGRILGTAYLIGTGCYLMAGVALYLLLEFAFQPTAWGRGLALAGAVGFATIGPVLYLALSGMETLLFLTLALWSLVAFMRGRYGWTGGLLAALCITRIEGLGLVFVLVLTVLVTTLRDRRQGGRRRVRSVLWMVVPPVLILFLYLGLNRWITGRFMPTTLAGRKWLCGLPDKWMLFSLKRARFFVRDWGRLLSNFVFADGGWAPWAVVVGLALVGLVDALRRAMTRQPGNLGPGLLVGWLFAHNLAYLMMFPAASARYQAPNLVGLPALAAVGAYAVVRVLRENHQSWAAALVGLAIVACLLPGSISYRQVYADNVSHINRVHVSAGQWVAVHLAPNALVAAFDVGAVRYVGNRRTLDLGGLVDARFTHEYLIPGRVGDYLYEQGATHLVMPEPAQEGQTDIGKRLGLETSTSSVHMRFRPLAEFQVPPYIRPPFDVLPYHFYTAYRRIVVYEIEYLDR